MAWSSQLVSCRTLLLILFLLLICSADADESIEVKRSLIGFVQQLSENDATLLRKLRWDASTNPCDGDGRSWNQVQCTKRNDSIQVITLEGLGLRGSINASLLCRAPSLATVRLRNNEIQGGLPPEITDCSNLTHLYLANNRLTGSLPSSLPTLGNLKILDISNNDFSGELPDLARISGLLGFLAQNNRLDGSIPAFWFSNFGLGYFNVSNNRFTGPIPQGADKFDSTCFTGNSGLCGVPLVNACPPSPSEKDDESPSLYRVKAVMLSGYFALGLVLLLFIPFTIISKKKRKGNKFIDDEKNALESNAKNSSITNKAGASRSEYSIPSTESAAVVDVSSSLIVLRKPGMNDLKFRELLKAPAELLGRGRFGSTYKVVMSDGAALAVKRIKDGSVPAAEFRRRMEKVDMAPHPNVLSAVAFYCSVQEKLVVYEYQHSGSLFNFLHGNQAGGPFDWSCRLRVAAAIAEAMAFMHKELQADGISHGNLKSSNILMNSNMDPCISEYGLILADEYTTKPAGHITGAPEKADVYGLGIVLLELLTGKLVQNDPFELARWVNLVVREEWTVEVFDKSLISDGASEERMVKTLQVALKCIHTQPDARPSMELVAAMVNAIREEDAEVCSL
ncbi:putative inactive receptor kinase [Canna indica]|uniref:Inactive receptor kinase n=1 Tax=Canna indica TaxID=4628 RepID=A0AAQ3KNJ5_9LILI|nr:putative inactive receptor kinase [Canna indica]